MPFHSKIQITNEIIAYFWKNTEDIDSMFEQVQLKESSIKRLEGMQSMSHRKGFLGVRLLLQHLGYTDFDLVYDETGKPHLNLEFRNQKLENRCSDVYNSEIKNIETLNLKQKNISISHSHEFSSICISEKEVVGIDLEKVKEKVLRIAPRFMDVKHLVGMSNEEQMLKSTVVWGVKESVFKVKNEVGISFPDHIHEDEFSLNDAICFATLTYNNLNERFKSHFFPIEDFMAVVTYQV